MSAPARLARHENPRADRASYRWDRTRLAEPSGVLDNARRGRKTRWRPSQYHLRTADPLRQAADPRPLVPVQDSRARGRVPAAIGVALVAHHTSHGCGAHCRGARARALVHTGLLAPTHAFLRETAAARAPRRIETGLLDLAVGRRGDRRDDRAEPGRRGDSRLVLAHRRPGAARLLSGAGARGRVPRDHAGRS